MGPELALERRMLEMVPHEMDQQLQGERAQVPLIGPDLDTIAGLESIAPAGGVERRDELESRDPRGPRRSGPSGQLGVGHG
jgi:hypothetical protein